MKKVLLLSLAFIIGVAVVAQRPQIKNGIFVRNYQKDTKITVEPFEKISASPFTSKKTGLKSGDNSDIVSVIDLGTSANVLGYSSGTRPMVWADDDLNVVTNIHRMGPGATPPSLSGYLGMDFGINMGATEGDWNSNIQVLAAQLSASPYFYDASRYPCAGIYNPEGNTSLENAYLTYIAPNFANLALSGFGGYSYGVANLVDHADTTKHLRWYDGNPITYIPDGFTVTNKGFAYSVDGGYDVITAAPTPNITYGKAAWNTGTKDFDWMFSSIECPTYDNVGLADVKIAASPDGMTMYMSALGQLVGSTPLLDSTYAPIVRKSTDGGQTWSDPKVIQLDGPNGISAVKNAWSDFFIENFFVGPPYPSRDEIPFTTAFDHSISVDKWGGLHIAVAISYTTGGASISYGVDSLINVFDIYSVDDGLTYQGVKLGAINTFRGTWATYTSDNRVYISRNTAGDKMFVTWNDTRIDGEANNQNPDIWARGFDLLTNKLTSDNGVDGPNNVTFLSDITQEAYWQCMSPIVFTDNNKFTLPICTQWFADAAADSKFKYIPDFSYVQSDFTISVNNPGFPVGVEKKSNPIATVAVYPNPVKDLAKVSVNLSQNANVTVEVTNLVGQQVMTLNKGNMTAGAQQFSIDARNLNTGVYFVTVNVNGQKFTQKMVVE